MRRITVTAEAWAMAHGTTDQKAAASEQTLPPDIETMRESARILLAEDAELPVLDELDTLALALRGHIQLLIPEVAQAAAREPKDSVPRYCALACIGEARNKLRMGAEGTLSIRLSEARKLARVLNALCDHYENLSQYQGASK